jgi:hypothetical protein
MMYRPLWGYPEPRGGTPNVTDIAFCVPVVLMLGVSRHLCGRTDLQCASQFAFARTRRWVA